MGSTLRAFSSEEILRVKRLLAGKVASMMGRKLEEGDWSDVYCRSKEIPDEGWSNLHIDVNHDGLGVEFKMLRIAQLRGRPLKSVCGTRRMHPAATRSVRIKNVNGPPDDAMVDVLQQYSRLIEERTKRVRGRSTDRSADMRVGWLLWEDDLREFMYFEERMTPPDANDYYAIWNETPSRGARKASKSLWVFDKATGTKRYSVTTSAGIKIQPYFDVPPPNDPNLAYFRVQSERESYDTVILWVTTATAARLRSCLGSIEKDVVSQAALQAAVSVGDTRVNPEREEREAVPIRVSEEAFAAMVTAWDAVSDEHRVQQLIQRVARGLTR